MLRLGFVGLLCTLPPIFAAGAPGKPSFPVFELVAVLLLTALPSIELWGRGFNIGGRGQPGAPALPGRTESTTFDQISVHEHLGGRVAPVRLLGRLAISEAPATIR